MSTTRRSDETPPAPARDAPAAAALARLALAAAVLFAALVRLRLLGVPLERDEGEYAYMGQLILGGGLPFVDAYSMKLPGTYCAYAALMAAFGQTTEAIHLALLLMNAATTVLVYALGVRAAGHLCGAVAAVVFALLSLSQSVLGFTANAEQFVVLPAAAGVLALDAAVRRGGRWRQFAAGLLFGTAFLMKQHAIAFIAFGLAWPVLARVVGITARPRRPMLVDAAAYCAGVALPYALVCLWMWAAGAFGPFWFWTVMYARQYVSMVTFKDGMTLLGMTIEEVTRYGGALWALAAVGLVALFFERPSRDAAVFGGTFAAFSFLAVCPGLLFRQHYFIMLLPATALLAGFGALAARELLRQYAPPAAAVAGAVALVAVAVAVSINQERGYLFELSPDEVSRSNYGENPFPEAVEVARYLREHVPEGEKVVVIGSEPEVYFYARRRAATGYIYTYPLMEPHPFALDMQKQLMKDVEAADPAYVVFVNVRLSWLPRPDSHRALFDWVGPFLKDRYDLVGVADIQYRGPHDSRTEYRWDAAARCSAPQSEHHVTVYARKPPAPRPGP